MGHPVTHLPLGPKNIVPSLSSLPGNEVDASKHQSFGQVDTILFDEFGQVCSKYPDKFAVSLWYLKKEVRNEVDFLQADEQQSFP